MLTSVDRLPPGSPLFPSTTLFRSRITTTLGAVRVGSIRLLGCLAAAAVAAAATATAARHPSRRIDPTLTAPSVVVIRDRKSVVEGKSGDPGGSRSTEVSMLDGAERSVAQPRTRRTA